MWRLEADALHIRGSDFQRDAALVHSGPRPTSRRLATILRRFLSGTRSRAVLGGFWGCLGATDRAGHWIQFLGQKSRR
jgi:hypothetical protein